MGIRTAMNDNPGVAMGVSVCVILLTAAFIFWTALKPKYAGPVGVPKAFFSDDDGATWFVGEAIQPVPFDHDGKQAFRAAVFRCNGGKPFVAYLARYSDDVNTHLALAGPPTPDYAGFAIAPPPSQVKVPGKTRWVDPASGERARDELNRIIAPVCPDGGTDRPTVVLPGDPHSGAIN